MDDCRDVLDFLGYTELRMGGEDWRPIEAADGRFGTTDRTKILSRKNRPTCHLVDRETGRLVATARKSCPVEPEGAVK